MKSVVLLVFVFLIGWVSASSVTCVIVDNKVLVEMSLSEGDDVVLPGDYSLLEREGSKVSFISRDFIKRDGEWIFVFPVVVTGVYDLEVYLPSGYVLADDLVYPKGYEISSDGRSIILRWEDVSEEVIVFYEGVESSYFWFWIVIFGLVILGLGFWVLEKRKFFRELERLREVGEVREREKRKGMVSHNLFGDEKRVVEFLMKRKSCWMKDLVRELGMSKVMCTRKVRSLVEKGIVEKESFGRENKIRLKK